MKYLMSILLLFLSLTVHSSSYKYTTQHALELGLEQNYHAVVAGKIKGKTITRKFGANDTVGTSWEPITSSGTYQTPTTAQTVEIVSDDNTNDKSGGTGALKIMVIGLDANWDEQSEELTLNGTTAVASAKTWLRVYRLYVTESGTYASPTGPSHNSTITVQSTGAGVVWATIAADNNMGLGQSQVGVFSVPRNKKAYIISAIFTIESTKIVNLAMFKRLNADDVTTPFDARRIITVQRGATDTVRYAPKAPINGFEGPSDVGFMAYTTVGASQISVEFEILLEDLD